MHRASELTVLCSVFCCAQSSTYEEAAKAQCYKKSVVLLRTCFLPRVFCEVVLSPFDGVVHAHTVLVFCTRGKHCNDGIDVAKVMWSKPLCAPERPAGPSQDAARQGHSTRVSASAASATSAGSPTAAQQGRTGKAALSQEAGSHSTRGGHRTVSTAAARTPVPIAAPVLMS